MMSFHSANDRGDSRGTTAASGQRWLLWVDAAGGYAVLGGRCWSIGGPAGEGEAAICVQADLRRQHAQLARVGRDYALYPAAGSVSYPAATSPTAGLAPGGEPSRPGATATAAAGSTPVGAAMTELREPLPLRCSDRFLLGRSVGFRFVQPSPLSGSARLSVESPHRLRPYADAVLLWADTLVVGPTLDCHVVVPHAEGAIVLLQRAGQWLAKPWTGPGDAAKKPEPLAAGRRLLQMGIALTWEPA